MARTQTKSTLSPGQFATGAVVLAEHGDEVVQMLNWAAGNRPQTHLALTCAPAAWSSGSPKTLSISFRASGSDPVLQVPIQVQPEVVNLTCRAQVVGLTNPGTPDSVDVVFKTYNAAGSLTATSTALTFTDTAENNTTKSTNIATATSGTGWLTLVVEIETQVGAATADLLFIVVEDEVITSGQPAPIIEGDG